MRQAPSSLVRNICLDQKDPGCSAVTVPENKSRESPVTVCELFLSPRCSRTRTLKPTSHQKGVDSGLIFRPPSASSWMSPRLGALFDSVSLFEFSICLRQAVQLENSSSVMERFESQCPWLWGWIGESSIAQTPGPKTGTVKEPLLDFVGCL